MAIVTGDRYLDLLARFVEEQAGGLLDGSLVLKLNPVGLHYVQTRLDALHELERLRTGAPVDYLRAYISDLGDHRALEQLSRVLSLLTSVKVVSVLPTPARDPSPVTLSPFGRLKSLELRGCDLSTSAARGLLQLRAILERLICHNSADALRHIFTERIQEVQNSQVWSRLTFVSCATNGMVLMDDSLQLLPAVQFLDLSRNRFAKAANLHCCARLKFLDLGFNQLRNISSLRQIKSQITNLVLKNNALVSVHGIAALTSLEALDLSNNLISKFKDIQSVATIPSLQIILLEGNPLSASASYREEVFSFFPDPSKVYLDGRKILQSEIWTVNRIVSKRQKQEALYGSYAPAETIAEMQAEAVPMEHADYAQHTSDAGTNVSRVKRKASRLALIHDAQPLLKETVEQDESSGFHVSSSHSRDIKERRQDFSDEGDQEKTEAIQLMQKVEALKEEGSKTWLQEVRVLLENNDNSSGQGQQSFDLQDENKKLMMDSKLKELRKMRSRRRRRRQQRSLEEGLVNEQEQEEGLERQLEEKHYVQAQKDKESFEVFSKGVEEHVSFNDTSIQSGQNSATTSPRMSASSQVASDLENSVAPHKAQRDGNTDETMLQGLGYAGDEEQTSMDESFGSWRLIDEVVESRGTTGSLRSPPHYHEDVLQKRQNLEEELLRLSLDSGCAPSSSGSESSSDDSLIMISGSSRSDNTSPRGLADFKLESPKLGYPNIWQGQPFLGSQIEDNVSNYSSEESMSSGPRDRKGIESVDDQQSMAMPSWPNIPKEKATEALRSSHLNPACTDDIRANAGGGQNQVSSEVAVSKPRVKRKTRRVRTVDLYEEKDAEGIYLVPETQLIETNGVPRASETDAPKPDYTRAALSSSKLPSSHCTVPEAGKHLQTVQEGERAVPLLKEGVVGLGSSFEDLVENIFRLKIANAEEAEVCCGHVKCGCIRLWEESPTERNIHLLLSNKDKLYMLTELSSREGNLSVRGSDLGLHVIASHRLQEVKKIMVGLGLQALRVDIGHAASYLFVTRDINVSREILDMLRRSENSGPAPDFESWEQRQLRMFEELVLGGAKTNILMYLMPLFSHGDSLENIWASRSVFLTSHHIFICIEDLVHFGAASEESVGPQHPYFVMEAAADIYDLSKVVAGFTDGCVTLNFEKTISGCSTLLDYQNEQQKRKSTVWKFKGVLEEAASKLVALLHANHMDFAFAPSECKESQMY